MAVPSPWSPSFRPAMRSMTIPRSVVRGLTVRECPAKTRRPTRSLERPSMNLRAHAFATEKRFFGRKSSAAIEPEASRAMKMSTPSVHDSVRSRPSLGLASETTRPA